jgi:hypothetical protein
VDFSNPLLPIVSAWIEAIQKGNQKKAERFTPEAEEGLRFFCGPYDFFYDPMYQDSFFRGQKRLPADGSIVMSVNKVSEMVQLFGPSLYHKNPDRAVTPLTFPALSPSVFMTAAQGNPQANLYLQQQAMAQGNLMELCNGRAELFKSYVNYTPDALDLKTETRRAVDEMLITGLSLMWTEPVTPPGSPYQMIGSFHDSQVNFTQDPSAKTVMGGKWVARRCVKPAWEVEREYGLPPGYLRPTVEGAGQWATYTAGDLGPTERTTDGTGDKVVYWKVYSKMGLGGRLPRVSTTDDQLRQVSDLFGDYCHLAVMVGVPHPLNLPPWVTNAEGGMKAAQARAQWPTPYWADGGWPCVPYYIHEKPDDPWPVSHLSPAMGEMKFLNWFFTKMVNKIRTTSRDLIAVSDQLSQELEDALAEGDDLAIIRFEGLGGKSIKELIEFLQHPQWNKDLFQVADYISNAFDQRTGLTELMYGQSSRQYRSAEEAKVKGDQVSIRPDDMANKVEDAASVTARREVLAAFWHLSPADVAPVVGPLGAIAWANLIYAAPPAEIIYNLQVRVEAGTARKPNRAAQQDSMQQATQMLLTPLYQYAGSTGNVNPVNALIKDWGKANDVRNIEQYQLTAPPPPEAGPANQPPAAAGKGK